MILINELKLVTLKPSSRCLKWELDRPGQLHHLSELTHPDVAVITMIGEAHIEFFGSRSVYGGFAVWQKGNSDETSYAYALDETPTMDLHLLAVE